MKKLLFFLTLCALSVPGLTMTTPPSKPALPVWASYRPAGGLMDLFQQLDPKILQSQDDAAIGKYLEPFNVTINAYVKEHYGESLTDLFDLDDPTLFLSGFLIAHFELYQNLSGVQTKMAPGEILDCVGYAIGFGKGIKELIASYTELLSGSASFNTVYAIIKNVARRYVAWFMVGYTIYKFGDCMNWW